VPRYRVMLRCDQTVIHLEEKPTEVGFFTTRAVDATTPEAAVAAAIVAVRKDLVPRISEEPAGLDIQVEELTQESWWWRRLRPPTGFTFFLVQPEDQQQYEDEDDAE
jgi:hypothetical protein